MSTISGPERAAISEEAARPVESDCPAALTSGLLQNFQRVSGQGPIDLQA